MDYDTQQFAVLDAEAISRTLRETEDWHPPDADITIDRLRAQLQVVEYWARYVRAHWPQLVSTEGDHRV